MNHILDRLRAERTATAGFALLVVVALPLILYWGRDQWFFLDEWSFLAARPLPSLDGFFENHNGHWVTLPLVVYRANFELFGLTTYLPYQIPVVVAHLAIAVLGQVVMRRMGVQPWLGALAGVGFVFLGAGFGNIVFGFQITLNGSVIAGLVQLVLADHDGQWSRRDTVGVTVGVVGLMTSAVAVPMCVGVGAFVLLRRGWRIAAAHTVAPGVVFVGWWLAFGGAEQSDFSIANTLEFAFHMWRATFEALSQSAVGGAVLFAVAAIGLGLAVRAGVRRNDLTRVAIPVGLTTALLAFSLVTAVNRSGFDDDIRAAASQGRYVHVGAALMVPLVALGAQRLWEYRRPLVLVPLIALAAGLPDNIDALRNPPPFALGNEDLVLAIAHSPLLDDVRGDHQPVPFSEVEAAWLLAGARNGDIPEPGDHVTEQQRLNADTRIVFQEQATVTPPCEPVEGRIAQTVDQGDEIVFGGPSDLVLARGELRSAPRRFAAGTTVKVLVGPVDIIVRDAGDDPPTVCIRQR